MEALYRKASNRTKRYFPLCRSCGMMGAEIVSGSIARRERVMVRLLRRALGVVVVVTACWACDSTVPTPPTATVVVAPTATPDPHVAPSYAQIHTVFQRIWNDFLPRAAKLARLQTYAASLAGKRLTGWQGWVIAIQREPGVPAYADLYLADPYLEGRDQVQYWSSDDNEPDYSHGGGELYLRGLSSAQLSLLTIGEAVQVDGLLTRAGFEYGAGFTVENPVLTALLQPPLLAGTPTDLRDTVLTVRQTGGMMAGRDHEILVHGDGAVLYNSLDYNQKVIGRKTAILPLAQVAALARLFDRVNYTGLRVSYTEITNCVVEPAGGAVVMASEALTFRTSLTDNGQTTSVAHSTGLRCAPVKLTILENRLNDLVYTTTWAP